MTKVYIDPKTDVNYSGFYILGLYELYGRKNVFFSSKYFKELSINSSLRFTLVSGNEVRRYVVDWADLTTIDLVDYEWCHIYGKVNYNKSALAGLISDKVVRLPPGFGIKVWPYYKNFYFSIVNLFKVLLSDDSVTIKRFISKYFKVNRQLYISAYKPTQIFHNYIYSLNTLWQSNEWIDNDSSVNYYRANFIEACKSIESIEFEGGFVQSSLKNLHPRYINHLIEKSFVGKSVYLDKISRSFVVFNTPAWAFCHGWKLGEYLALGKAIISTPLINELPYPLEHGKHVHIVSGEIEDTLDAINYIRNNKEYRMYLQKNAYDYYTKYVSPAACLNLLIKS